MEKKALLELENRCVQEEPAECVAACPLHLDARSFVGAASRGDWDAAWKILLKTLPLPSVLARICDAPCRKRCKRGLAGDPIQIGELERACANQPVPTVRMPPLPKKKKRVAVMGGGLSGLTLAWDLGRKGYEVHIFEPGPAVGGPLLDVDPKRLPPNALAAEIDTLKTLGVLVKTDAPASADFLEETIQKFDAVYLSLETTLNNDWPLDRDSDGRIVVVPKVQTTSREGLFAGGQDRDGGLSFIHQAAQGRWAATSIDRYLQKVSPSAGREKEGPYPTRLITWLDGVLPESAVDMANPSLGYSPEEAVAEASRCIQCECLECVKVCAYLERFGAYPKKYTREIYNNESIVMGVRQANKLINSCSLCGLCETVCPVDFPMQDLCLTARESMVKRGKMPPSAHEFALMDMEFSQSDAFTLARHEPGRDKSAHLFFPGCQLCASAPDTVVQAYDCLRNGLSGGVGLMLDCCAAPALWAGRRDEFEDALERFRKKWKDMESPRIIAACSTCFRVFQDFMPDLPVVSLWRVMAEGGLDLTWNTGPSTKTPADPVAILDPCATRYEPEIRNAVRLLLKQMGVAVEELYLRGKTTECCGFGGLMQNANPDLAREVVRRRAEQSKRDYLAYCAMCRDNLAAAGKRTLHLLDLIFPDPETPDPAARPWPRWSRRRDNRTRLKARLLNDLWKEPPTEMTDSNSIQIHKTPEVKDALDRRRILDEDMKQVIHHAETSGQKLRHPTTGLFKATLKIHNAVFWVEYASLDDGFVIHNAYSHRMEVKSA